jgi:hypothetical protein
MENKIGDSAGKLTDSDSAFVEVRVDDNVNDTVLLRQQRSIR